MVEEDFACCELRASESCYRLTVDNEFTIGSRDDRDRDVFRKSVHVLVKHLRR